MWISRMEYPISQPVPAPTSALSMPMPAIPLNYPLLFSRQPIPGPFCTSAPPPHPQHPQQTGPELTSILLQQQQQELQKQKQGQHEYFPRPRLIVVTPQQIQQQQQVPHYCVAPPNYTYNYSFNYYHGNDVVFNSGAGCGQTPAWKNEQLNTDLESDLERSILFLLEKNQMTLENNRQRWLVLKQLEDLLCFGEIHPFGSFLTGLGSNSSDVDVYFQDQENRRKDVVMKLVLYAIEEKPEEDQDDKEGDKKSESDSGRDSEPEENPWKILQVLTNVRIPLITLEHRPSEIKIDISFENNMSVQNSKLIRFYAELEPSVSLLARLIRLWADKNKLMDRRNGLKNYSITLLVLVFLMQRKLIPTVQLLQSLCPPQLVKVSETNSVNGNKCDECEWNIAFCDDLVQVKAAMARARIGVGIGGQSSPGLVKLTLEFFHFLQNILHRPNCAVISLTGEIRERQDFSHILRKFKGQLPESQARYTDQVSDAIKERFATRGRLCLQDPFNLAFNLMSNVDADYFQLLCSATRLTIAIMESQRLGQCQGQGQGQDQSHDQRSHDKKVLQLFFPDLQISMATQLNLKPTQTYAPSPFLGPPVFQNPGPNLNYIQNRNQYFNMLGINSNPNLPPPPPPPMQNFMSTRIPAPIPAPIPIVFKVTPQHPLQNFPPPEIPLFTTVWSLSEILKNVSALYFGGTTEKNLLNIDSLSPYELSQYRQFWYEATVDYFKFGIQASLPISHRSKLEQQAEFCRRPREKSNSISDSSSKSSSSLNLNPEMETATDPENCTKSSCDCRDGGLRLPSASNLSFSVTLNCQQLRRKGKKKPKDKIKTKDLFDLSIFARIIILKNDKENSAQVNCTVRQILRANSNSSSTPFAQMEMSDRKLISGELVLSFANFVESYIHQKIKDSWALEEILQEKRWMEMGELGGSTRPALEPEVDEKKNQRSRNDSDLTESSLDFSLGFSISEDDPEDPEDSSESVQQEQVESDLKLKLDIESLSSWPPLENSTSNTTPSSSSNSPDNSKTYFKLNKNGLMKLAAQRSGNKNPHQNQNHTQSNEKSTLANTKKTP